MNIFLLSMSAVRAARFHCNKHCLKMILETCQILYAAHWINTTDPKWDFTICSYEPYKKTHVNHPSCIWARSHSSHYDWLIKLGLELCKEYTRRYSKDHKCYTHLLRLQKMGFPVSKVVKEHKIDRRKMAQIEIPKGTEYFLCAINDELFDKCAVYKDGKLAGVSTYRNYYTYKEWELKWERNATDAPLWYTNLLAKRNVIDLTNE